jgi:hypothetical protein
MTSEAPLRGCPTCKTPVTKAQLGLRDYSRWLDGMLPGKVSASDVDFCLDQAQTGRLLIMEFKDGSQRLGVGQRLMFKALKEKGADVWVVWDRGDKGLLAGELDDTAQVRFTQEMTPVELAAKVKAWWYDGLTA